MSEQGRFPVNQHGLDPDAILKQFNQYHPPNEALRPEPKPLDTGKIDPKGVVKGSRRFHSTDLVVKPEEISTDDAVDFLQRMQRQLGRSSTAKDVRAIFRPNSQERILNTLAEVRKEIRVEPKGELEPALPVVETEFDADSLSLAGAGLLGLFNQKHPRPYELRPEGTIKLPEPSSENQFKPFFHNALLKGE